MKFSEDQQRAIEARGTNVLVSAGAGSGKTAVLTERVVNLLNDNLKINNILVLTFTNNAAKEMKDRIRLKLEDKNDHENLLLLDNSYITTFDAFSLSVLERYHDVLDLSPGIGILSEEVLSYITRKNIKKIFYKPEYKLLRDKFLTDKEDDLIELLLKIKTKLSILPNPKKYLEDYKINFTIIEEFKKYVENSFNNLKEEIENINGSEKFIEDLNKMGIPIGDMPDGSPNLTIGVEYARWKEIVRTFHEDAKIQTSNVPGGVSFTGAGANAGGPVVVEGVNTNASPGYGLIS